MVRIIANDGFSTASLTSSAFVVRNRPPMAAIIDPVDGQRFNARETIVLRGRIWDPEDGNEQRSHGFLWTFDGGIGRLGSEVILPEGLPPGEHVVELRTRDSDGATSGVESMTITVEDGRVAAPDTDGDGVPNPDDNCLETENPGQEDADGDGVGDACDNCPLVANPDQGNHAVTVALDVDPRIGVLPAPLPPDAQVAGRPAAVRTLQIPKLPDPRAALLLGH